MNFLSEYTNKYFKKNGLLSESLDYFEYRENQHYMALDVSDVIENGGIAILEAGTGIGKTFAYLIPAILSGERVVIATKSKNLQEQLFFKDIELIKKVIPFAFKSIYIKGRNNYICLEKLSKISISNVFFKNNLVKIINKWVKKTKFGDISELNELSSDPLIHSVTSSSETCKGSKCGFFKDCFVYKLKIEAEKSDLIIVNYHLLFADYRIKNEGFGKVVPEYKYLVCDEAHSIEEIATEYLGDLISKYYLLNLVKDLENNNLSKINKLNNSIEEFFLNINAVVTENNRKNIDEIINPKITSKADELMNMLSETCSELSGGKSEDAELLVARIKNCIRIIDEIFFNKDFSKVKWVERTKKNTLLKCFPVDVSSELKDLFYNLKGGVFTSATLSVNGSFDFFKSRLGLELTDKEKIYPSLFDFSKQSLLFIPKGLPEPSSNKFINGFCKIISELLCITNGNAFILFTNLKNMNLVAEYLKKRNDYNIMVQGETSNVDMINRFKRENNSVLLGSYSFWEGIDIQGDNLSLVAIEKLPFAVPSDPLKKARIDTIKENNGNPFYEYQIPEAVMLLKQGIGRLIRSKKDRGIVAIFDSRMFGKSYGKIFLKNLPEMKMYHTVKTLKEKFSEIS